MSTAQPPPGRSASPEELRQLYQGLLQRLEEERTRIAQQIHNELGQSLTAILMAVKRAQRQTDAAHAAVGERLHLAETLLDETIQTVRRIATDLRPGLLDHFGLGAAVEWQMQQTSARQGWRHQLQVQLDESQVTPMMATVAFRIFQEALATIRQDDTDSINVNLAMVQDGVTLTIQAGSQEAVFHEQKWPDLAVVGMYEHAQLIGGRVAVLDTPGQNTALVLWFPHHQGEKLS